ncbi:MAG: FadR/GntR family transcriptional regulator [Pseudoflavonifractor sp.]|nr:FadR/GntR family transcriptional regulator [Pseudoflavonifractor sp.]
MTNEAKPLSMTVEEQIIQIIKDNELRPGDRLDTEMELSRRLGVGRGTVREAIKGLVSRNILVVRQGSGTFISPRPGVSDDPLGLTFAKQDRRLALDLLDVRLMLEPEMAAMAADRATDYELKRLEAQCAKVERFIRGERPYRQEDVEFHRCIAQASHNQVVGTLVPVIHSSASLNIDLTRNELKENTMRSHRELANAIRDRDPQRARYAMILHLAENRRYLQEPQE